MKLIKRLEKLEATTERREFEPFHIIRAGSKKGPDRKYYVGEDDFVQIHCQKPEEVQP